jgi:hypothetical protein
MRTTAVILICWFLTGCGTTIAVPIGTPIGHGLLSREQAIAAAVRSASMSRPEVSGALVIPQNVQAEQMELSEAIKRLPGNPSMVPGYNSQTPVWVVTMDGLWANEAQAPGVTATQQPYHHYLSLLDAKTGMEIQSYLKP